jgi:HTH-type transcriptional regulator/antitoxin HigA
MQKLLKIVSLKEIAQSFDAQPNTPEYERLDILTTLVEVY